jgi:thiamine pyrophosphate-dependent acetolactate synthase large subunit-like protein
VLDQVTEALGGITPATYEEWRARLAETEKAKLPKHEAGLSTDQVPIHPLRLCKEVRDFIDRDTILCVDGQEILNYGRQSIPSYVGGHRLNSGPFGTMGVGLPFGVGAKAANPQAKVVVLHGDGSFGLNAMEIDTAIRHKLPVLIVISLNGGWTADPKKEKPGRDLGYARFDLMGAALGCHGEYVEEPADIRPALERAAAAVERGQTAIVAAPPARRPVERCQARGTDAAGQAADPRHRQRHHLVAGLRGLAPARRPRRHPVLHDAAGQGRGAGGSSLLLCLGAFAGLQGGGPRHRRRHPAELRHLQCRAAAVFG